MNVVLRYEAAVVKAAPVMALEVVVVGVTGVNVSVHNGPPASPLVIYVEWYKLSGCTKRSMVENAVYRYKAIIGPEMRTRTLARQRVEHRIGCEILNKMTALGMPDTYCAG